MRKSLRAATATLLLGLAGAANAADISILQAFDGGIDSANNATNRTMQYPSNVSSGSVLLVCMSTRDNNPLNLSISDNKSNTWTSIGSTYEPSGRGVQCAYAKANVASVGARPIITLNKGGSGCGVGGSIYELANVHTDVLDGTPSAAMGQTSGPAQATPGSTTYTNDLIFGAMAGEAAATVTATTGSGYTAQISNTSTPMGFQHKTITKATTTAGSYTPNWTLSKSSAWAVLSFALKGNTTAPTITGTSPSDFVSQSATLTINGLNLKASGNSTVTFGGVSQTVGTQSATAPAITVSRGTNKYGVTLPLILTDSASAVSNTYSGVGIIPPSGWSYVNLASPATSGVRITAVSDLTSGDQLAYDNKGGLVTVLPDATFVADQSVTSFSVEAWTSGSGWGSSATQTITDAGGGTGSNNQKNASMFFMFPR